MNVDFTAIVDRIEALPDGTLQVRFLKGAYDPETGEFAQGWHRTVFAPGTDIDRHMAAVNVHLATFGLPAVATAGIDLIKDARGKRGLVFDRDRKASIAVTQRDTVKVWPEVVEDVTQETVRRARLAQ